MLIYLGVENGYDLLTRWGFWGIIIGELARVECYKYKKRIKLTKMANKTVLMIAPQTDTFVNFRGDLICDIRKKGYDVTVVVPEDMCREFFEKNDVKVRLIGLKKNSFSGVFCRRLESNLSIRSCWARLNATTPRLRFGYFSMF